MGAIHKVRTLLDLTFFYTKSTVRTLWTAHYVFGVLTVRHTVLRHMLTEDTNQTLKIVFVGFALKTDRLLRYMQKTKMWPRFCITSGIRWPQLLFIKLLQKQKPIEIWKKVMTAKAYRYNAIRKIHKTMRYIVQQAIHFWFSKKCEFVCEKCELTVQIMFGLFV